MRRLTYFIVSIIALTVILAASSDNTDDATSPESSTEQTQSASGTAKIFSFSGTVNSGAFVIPDKGDPLEAAYQFFELNKKYYHLDNPRHQLIRGWVRADDKSTTVLLKQVHNGIELRHSDIRLHFNSRGELREVEGSYVYDINLSTTPKIDSAAAENLVQNDLASAEYAEIRNSDQYSTALTIWRDNDGKFRLIWVVWAKAYSPPRPYFWQYYIDAHDGTILQRRDQIRYNVPQTNR